MAFDTFRQGLRSAVRNLVRAPGFALITILMPGVQHVAGMSGLPPQRQVNANDTEIEDYTAPKDGPDPVVVLRQE